MFFLGCQSLAEQIAQGERFLLTGSPPSPSAQAHNESFAIWKEEGGF